MIFTILGKPVPKQRPRFANGHAYTPKKTQDYERYVQECYRASNGPYLHGAIEMIVRLYYKKPKQKQSLYATKRPDIDNACKIYMDSLNGIAYKDDSQVVKLKAYKLYDDLERVEIEMRSLDEADMD